MQTPHVSFYVTPNGSLAVCCVLNTTAAEPLETETPLDYFDGRGYEETIKYLGRVVLASMGNMYPKEMANHPALHVPYNPARDMDTLHHLISKSITQKTKTFLPAIDAMVEEITTGDPMLRADIAISTWPDVREMIERRY